MLHGMAIITAATYQTLSDQTFTGSTLDSVTAWCAGVSAAILKAIRPFQPEPITQTDIILNAPIDEFLILPIVPVRSITSVYYNPFANGNPAAFTSDDLLAATQYQLMTTQPEGYSRSGLLRRCGLSNLWGADWRNPVTMLASKLVPLYGAIKVTYLAGPASLPADIQDAAVLAVSLMLQRKKTGAPLSSEGWNGYNYSLASAFTATSAVNSPDVLDMLMPYRSPAVGGLLG